MALNSFEALSVLLAVATLGGVVFNVYNHFRKPDIKADKEISLIKQRCQLTHAALDEDISGIHKTLSFIQDNHLRHIETDLSKVSMTQSKILGILEAKYQIKIQE